MKIIYFIQDETGFKYTGMMFTSRKAAERHMKNEMKPRYPERTFKVDFGYAFSK